MVVPDNAKKNESHLILAMLPSGVFLLGGPYMLTYLGLMKGVKHGAWLIPLVAFIAIVLKAIFSFGTTDNFRYDRFGYDLCVFVMGGMLTCIAAQFMSNIDLFPGLEGISFLGFTSSLSINTMNQHLLLLFLLFLTALVGVGLSGIGVARVENGKPQWRWVLSLFAFANLLLGVYGLILVAKG